MNISQIRRENTLFIITTQFNGNKSACAVASGIDPSAMYRFFNTGRTGRNIGNNSARKIEMAGNKSRYWLDTLHTLNYDKAQNFNPHVLTDSRSDYQLDNNHLLNQINKRLRSLSANQQRQVLSFIKLMQADQSSSDNL